MASKNVISGGQSLRFLRVLMLLLLDALEFLSSGLLFAVSSRSMVNSSILFSSPMVEFWVVIIHPPIFIPFGGISSEDIVDAPLGRIGGCACACDGRPSALALAIAEDGNACEEPSL